VMKDKITAADFISRVETAVKNGRVSEKGRKIFLRDMSDIIEKINENYMANSSVNTVFLEHNAFVVSFGYIRGYYKTGVIASEEWNDQEGAQNRGGDKPAVINYYTNGKIKSEEWFSSGDEHRDNGLPAAIFYRPDGTVMREEHWVDGIQQGYADEG